VSAASRRQVSLARGRGRTPLGRPRVQGAPGEGSDSHHGGQSLQALERSRSPGCRGASRPQDCWRATRRRSRWGRPRTGPDVPSTFHRFRVPALRREARTRALAARAWNWSGKPPGIASHRSGDPAPARALTRASRADDGRIDPLWKSPLDGGKDPTPSRAALQIKLGVRGRGNA